MLDTPIVGDDESLSFTLPAFHFFQNILQPQCIICSLISVLKMADNLVILSQEVALMCVLTGRFLRFYLIKTFMSQLSRLQMVEAKILQIDGKAAPRLINDTETGQSEWNRAAVNFFKRLTSRVVLQ